MTGFANFTPKRRLISDVTNSIEAIVTTTEDHGYFVGQFVRLQVPSSYQMELLFVIAQIMQVTSNTFTTNINTTQLATYNTPIIGDNFTQSHCVPITGTTDNIAV